MTTLRHFWTAASLCTIATLTLSQSGLADERDIKVGDAIVVLRDTHVQAGSEKLAPVEAGTELVTTDVNDGWVAVTVKHDGKTVSGWIRAQYLMAGPEAFFSDLFAVLRWRIRFAKLDTLDTTSVDKLVATELKRSKDEPGLARSAETAFQLMDQDGNGTVTFREFTKQPSRVVFLRIDADSDGSLSHHEFLVGASKPALDELNSKLRKLTPSPDEARSVDGYLRNMDMMISIAGFEGWKRELAGPHEVDQILKDFLRSRDLRRSRLAQELVDREEPTSRHHRAGVMFKWADKNHDGKLTLEEFKRGMGKQN